MPHVIINGRLLPEAEATVPVSDRGFRYGDGVFETLAVEGGVPYRFDWHFRRLIDGLYALKIEFDAGTLQDECLLLLQKNTMANGTLRIQITRGSGSKGYLPAGTNKPTCVIETAPPTPLPKEPVALWLSHYAKISPTALPVRYKLCQGVNSTLARMEAAEYGCFDALLLNDAGHICETSSANIFWVRDDILYTPALSCGILEGSTRDTLMRLSPFPVREVDAGQDALAAAQAVFITNASWGVVSVDNLLPDALHWNSQKIAQRFAQLLAQDRSDYCQAHRALWQKQATTGAAHA